MTLPKVERVPPVPLRPTFRIELDERDAEILRALVGGIGCPRNGAVKDFVHGLYRALCSAGVGDNSDDTFSDFFEGDVACK